MAATFSAKVQTANSKFDPSGDNKTPQLGSLALKSMPTTTALAGTTGTDSKLIHGDRWQQIDGNQTEKIDKDLKTDIMENQTYEIHENLKFKVDGKTTDTRVEDVKEYYLAESLFEYTLGHTDLHHEKDHQINPTHTFDILNIEGEYKNIDLAIKAFAIEAKGVSTEVIGAKAEAWGAGAEAWGVQVGAGLLENTSTMFHAEEDAAKAELLAMHNEIKALQSQVAAAKVIIMPVRVGICIGIHIDSPFA